MLASIKNLLLATIVLLLSGCGQLYEMVYCEYGQGGVENNFFDIGVNMLNECLQLDHLSEQQKAKYLQTRAWAHYSIGNNELALTDQENAFEIQPPTQHYEFINHAAYLQRLQLYAESLAPLKAAQMLDRQTGQPRMLTQYNLGWSLYELGRFEQAVEAFNIGIPQQPDYPFVYLRRGLAFFKQGRKKPAMDDFSEFLLLVEGQKVNMPADLKKEIDALPGEFSEIKNL